MTEQELENPPLDPADVDAGSDEIDNPPAGAELPEPAPPATVATGPGDEDEITNPALDGDTAAADDDEVVENPPL